MTLSLLHVEKKQDNRKTKKNGLRFKVVDLLAWGAPPQGGKILKIPVVSRVRSSGRGRRRGLTSNLLKVFFLQNSRSCPQAYRGGGRQRKSPLDGAVDFLSKLRHHIMAVSFVSALMFVLIRKLADVYKYVLLWPKHNLVHFKNL